LLIRYQQHPHPGPFITTTLREIAVKVFNLFFNALVRDFFCKNTFKSSVAVVGYASFRLKRWY